MPTYNIEVIWYYYTYPSRILHHLNDRGNAAFFSLSRPVIYSVAICRGTYAIRAIATNDVIVWGYVWGYIVSVEKRIACDQKEDRLKRNVSE